MDVEATSKRWNDVVTTSFGRRVPIDRPKFANCKKDSSVEHIQGSHKQTTKRMFSIYCSRWLLSISPPGYYAPDIREAKQIQTFDVKRDADDHEFIKFSTFCNDFNLRMFVSFT